MAGLVVAASLVVSLLLVHFSLHGHPLPRARPLDVDTGLPLPELGQASTVFSLTALFGAYLGVHLLLGIPALMGLAFGTGIALFAIRDWVVRSGATSFDDFLARSVAGGSGNAFVTALALGAIQCAYASSELLILQSVADVSLGLRADHATLLAVLLGVTAYFYVLFGGYMAVFKTDVLQFGLVAAMGIVALALAGTTEVAHSARMILSPRPGYWSLGATVSGTPLYAYHFLLGSVMGCGFLLASPDAWKRIYLVARGPQQGRKRFAIFAFASTAPFLLLIPMVRMTKPIPDGTVDAATMLAGVLSSNAMFVATTVALIASFLSAFNGAILASVHIGLVTKRRLARGNERPRFHWLMASALLVIVALFAAFRAISNPYFLANILLGPYALTAGVLAGTRGRVDRMPRGMALWLYASGFAVWTMYFGAAVGMPAAPSTYQINTVPGGVLLFGLAALASRLSMSMVGKHHDRV